MTFHTSCMIQFRGDDISFFSYVLGPAAQAELIFSGVVRLGRKATLLWRTPEPPWSFTKWWRRSGRGLLSPNQWLLKCHAWTDDRNKLGFTAHVFVFQTRQTRLYVSFKYVSDHQWNSRTNSCQSGTFIENWQESR